MQRGLAEGKCSYRGRSRILRVLSEKSAESILASGNELQIETAEASQVGEGRNKERLIPVMRVF